MSDRVVRAARSVVVAAATALVIVHLALLPFLTPAWIAFAQERAEASAWTGFPRETVRAATDAIVGSLITGAGDFDVSVGGQPVLNDAERGHMRDVRDVFRIAFVAAAAALLVLVGAAVAARRSRWLWHAIRAGAVALGVVVVALGIVALVAFDLGFELFHRVFFSGGNYTFDPSTDRLVQLFPQRFWFESSIAVGAVIVVLAAVVGLVAHRQLRETGRVAVGRPSWEAAR